MFILFLCFLFRLTPLKQGSYRGTKAKKPNLGTDLCFHRNNLYICKMAVVKPEKELIVNEMLSEIDFGASRGECLAINAEKWQLTTRTFDRYWKEALSRFTAFNLKTQNALDEVRVDAAKKRLKKAIMDKEERMELLTQIARGKLKYKKEVVTKDGVTIIEAKPEFSDRKNAVAELNKMDGSYEPIKKDITSGGEPLKQITGIIVE